MRRFIVKLLSWFLALMVILTVLDLSLSGLVQTSHKRQFSSWNDMVHGKAGADVLIMGSSRAWRQYSPRILDSILHRKTYNIGIDGSNINRQVGAYQVYRHFNAKPSVIIQNIDVWTIGSTQGYERYQYFPYFWIPYFRKVIFPLEPFSWAERYVPFYRYTHFGARNMIREPVIVEKGYQGSDKAWDGTMLAQQGQILFELDPQARKMFEDYMEQVHKEGIRMVLVFAPFYVGATEKVQNLDEMFAYYNALAEKYQATILDYTFDELSMDTLYFYNATHLNRTGAELFSLKLAEKLKEIL